MAIDSALLKNIIEAALLVNGKPQTIKQLATLFEGNDEVPDKNGIRQALDLLAEDYADRGIELKEVASGFRIQAKQELEPWISRLFQEKAPRYSRALLETLALIAYRQPTTRSEIEQVRGVSVSSYIMKTLLEREWIRVVGHREVPGRPAMYATTREFLDYFNLKGIEELPTLSEIRDLDKVPEVLSLPAMDPTEQTDNEADEASVAGPIFLNENQDEEAGQVTLETSDAAEDKSEGKHNGDALVADIGLPDFKEEEAVLPAGESIH